MKLILTMVLIFFLAFMKAQIDWIELPTHKVEHLEILYQTVNNRLIGVLKQADLEIYESNDCGSTWNLIAKGNTSFSLSSPGNIIAERRDGTLLIVLGREVYEVNENDNTLEFLFDTGFNVNSFDLSVLGNDDIIVISSQEIASYTSTGDQIAIVSHSQGVFTKAIVKGEGDIHYCLFREGLMKFNSDLTLVEENIANSILGYDANLVSDDNGVLYSNSKFSLDGYNWQSYPDGIVGMPTVTNTGSIHILGTDISGISSLYISNDSGISFDVFPRDFEVSENNIRTFPTGDNGIIYTSDNCTPELLVSYNGIDEWIDISMNLSIGKPHSEFVEAASKNLVITDGCSSYLRITNDVWDPVDDSDCSRLGNKIISFPDGSLYNERGCRSTDGGDSWINYGGSYFLRDFQLNASGAYYREGNMINASYNNGETWEQIPFDIPNFSSISASYNLHTAISASKQFYDNVHTSDAIVIRYDFNSELVDQINFTGSSHFFHPGLIASYNNEVVYGLVNNFNTVGGLFVYNEESREFSIKSLPESSLGGKGRIYVDHADYLYLMTPSSLFMSRDQGETWLEITPDHPDLFELTDIDVSWDGYLFLSTKGTPILRSKSIIWMKMKIVIMRLGSLPYQEYA